MSLELRDDFLNFNLEAFIQNAIDTGDIERKEIVHFAYDWVDIVYNVVRCDFIKELRCSRQATYLTFIYLTGLRRQRQTGHFRSMQHLFKIAATAISNRLPAAAFSHLGGVFQQS